jgi:hypothetical protein
MKSIGSYILSVCVLLAGLTLVGGCSHKKECVVTPRLCTPYGRPVTVAVVPILNYSGNSEIDSLKVTDILYSELQQVDGFAVIPVNRLLAQMVQENMACVETPEQALKLAQKLGADIIIVSAITEYNPFYPPVVGMAVQLFGQPSATSTQAVKVDPVTMGRMASPLKLNMDIDPQFWPKNQIQRIYNSRDKMVVDQVKKFADDRGVSNSPYGADVYMRSQEYYLRFVCYKAIAELLDREVERINRGAEIQTVDDDVKEYH